MRGSSITLHDDIIVLQSMENGVVQLKLVLGGYAKQNQDAVLFGTRFHYHQGKIISGLPSLYAREQFRDPPPNE